MTHVTHDHSPDPVTAPVARHHAPTGRAMWLLALALLLVFATLTLPGWGLAADTRSASEVNVAQSERITDDLYIAAGSVDFQGQASRDVSILTGDATIGGTIRGSLNLAAANADINGTIEGSLRIVSGKVRITGSIAGDVVVAGGQLELASSGLVGGNVLLASGSADLRGTVEGDVTGYAMSSTIGGTVQGSVDVRTSNLDVLNTARVTGSVTYTSRSDADVDSGAQLGQGINQENVDPWGDGDNPIGRSSGSLLRTLWALIAGVVLVVSAPRLADQLGGNGKNLVPAFILGVIGLIAVPLLALVLLATVIGIPAGLIVVVMFLIALYLTQVFAGMAIGRFILPNRWNDGSRGFHLLAMTIGVLLLGATRFIPLPFAGGILTLLITIWGLGAVVMLFVPFGHQDNGVAA